MITQRRVFQAKPGQAGAVVATMKAFGPILEKHASFATRIYTDFYSGPTDRVVWEFDAESMSQIADFDASLARNEELRKAFGSWFADLTPLIEGATVELWNREA
jgi:hypothetical protein